MASLKDALERPFNTLLTLSTIEGNADAYHRVRLAYRQLPLTVTRNAANQTVYDTTSPFQYLKVACWGLEVNTLANCTNIINRDGQCSNQNCSSQNSEAPPELPPGSCIRMRIDTAYDVPEGQDVPATPSRFYQNIFVAEAAYQTLRVRYNAITPPESRIAFPETAQQIWVDGFVRSVAGDARYENTIHTLFPQNTPMVAIIAQFTPVPYANRAKIHFLTIKDFVLPPLPAAAPAPATAPASAPLNTAVTVAAAAALTALASANTASTVPPLGGVAPTTAAPVAPVDVAPVLPAGEVAPPPKKARGNEVTVLPPAAAPVEGGAASPPGGAALTTAAPVATTAAPVATTVDAPVENAHTTKKGGRGGRGAAAVTAGP
jgi:hypothetical protein